MTKGRHFKSMSKLDLDIMVKSFIEYKIQGYSNSISRSRSGINEKVHLYLKRTCPEYLKATLLFKKNYVGTFSYLKTTNQDLF